MPGQILGDRYEIKQQLGKKAGRWTLLAQDLQTEALVILKLLSVDDELEPQTIKLFKREIDALQTLNHPATPQYLGYFEIDLPKGGKALVLVQSYLSGTSLADYLQQGQTLSEPEARSIAQSALAILNDLHHQQPPIVHRDLKPSNVLLAASENAAPQVYLVDFGSVKSLTRSDYTSFTMVGTDGYIPPEQIGGRAFCASDLYSLGMTLLTGITGKSPERLPRKGLSVDVEQIATLSPQFTHWLRQLTAPELDRRFKTAAEALQALGEQG